MDFNNQQKINSILSYIDRNWSRNVSEVFVRLD